MNQLFIKTETTGRFEQDEVLQINLVERNTDTNEVNNTSFLIKPRYHNSWMGASSVNGIYPKDVENCDYMDKFVPMLRKKFDNADVIIGHSLPFEMKMLAQSGMAMPDERKYVDIGATYSVRLAVGEFGDDGYNVPLKRYSLSALCTAYQLDDGRDFNVSKIDTIATLFDKMVETQKENYKDIAALQPSTMDKIGVDYTEIIKARNLRYTKEDYEYLIDDKNLFPSYWDSNNRLLKYAECITDEKASEEDIRQNISNNIVTDLKRNFIADDRELVTYTFRGEKYHKIFNEEQLEVDNMWNRACETTVLEDFQANMENRNVVFAQQSDFSGLPVSAQKQQIALMCANERSLISSTVCTEEFQEMLAIMDNSLKIGNCSDGFFVPKDFMDKIDLSENEERLSCMANAGASVPLTKMILPVKDGYYVPVDLLTMVTMPLENNETREFEKMQVPKTIDLYSQVTEPMSITVIYSGSKGNVTMMETDDKKKYLIDVGVTYTTQLNPALKKLGLKPKDFDGIFITHEHIDHIKGVAQVLKKFDCPVFATEGTWDMIRKKNKELVSKNAFVMPQHLFLNNLEVEKVVTTHDVKEPTGYKFERKGQTFTYVTDTGKVTESMLKAVKKADILMIESNHDSKMLEENENYSNFLKWRIFGDKGHLNNKDTLKLLNITKASKVYLAHLSEENNTPAIVRNMVLNSDWYKSNQELIQMGEVKFEVTKQDNLDIEASKSVKDKSNSLFKDS